MDGSDEVPMVQQPHVYKAAAIIIGFGGVSAWALSIAAEITRIDTYQILINSQHQLYCSYPPSSATWLASSASATLFWTQAFAILTGGFTWTRPFFARHVILMPEFKPTIGRATQRLLVVLVLDILISIVALAMLITSAVENAYHLSATPYGEGMLTCTTVPQGTFVAAAIFCLFSAALGFAYYFLAIKASEEYWMSNYAAAPVVVDMEAFSRDASRSTSITTVMVQPPGRTRAVKFAMDEKPRGASKGEGGSVTMTALTNTPVDDARLA